MPLPNPIKTPAFLQKLQWIADPVGYMESSAQQYPDIFASKVIDFADSPIFVNHPQGIQEVFNDRKHFAAPGEANRILRPLAGECAIFMLSGESHKRRRQLLMSPFHGERMQAYGEIICQLTEKLLNQLPLNKSFSARSTLQQISLQVILQAVFGLYEGERSQKIKDLMLLLLGVFRSRLTSSLFFFPILQKDLGAWSPWGRFLRQRQQMDELLYAEIAERREQPDPNRIDILSLLMDATDEIGNKMTDQELRNELITLIFGGHETTATAMAWALYWIHRKPEIKQKLLEELDSLGDSPDHISIFRLPYLTAVCNETLRLHPVAILTLSRVVQAKVELLGHLLEPGMVVTPCIYLAHQREDVYPQPKQFKPERFLERQFSPYEFLPFGGGVRGCIGQALALFEMKLVLATILSRYQLALADQQPEQPLREGVTVVPANGVKMLITGRRVRRESPVPMATTSAL
ncbi:MAG: cytochrome P450 [Nostoc sp. ChiSLP01]|nr:cytochrome P450 [Nostoc sp. CmiSLP01]MDZ8284017.1 cytochrome P450 [Nostoc sp. ChiSLP01]